MGYHPDNGHVGNGQKCSVSLTDKSLEIWKYFIGLEREPPAGQDYVPEATIQELELKLNETLALAPTTQGKRYCQYVYWKSQKPSWWDDDEWKSPEKCVAHGNPPDADGNDGTCQKDPGNMLTRPAAERIKIFLEDAVEIFRTEREENTLTPELQKILDDNPDTCTPGGSDCPPGSKCYDDLRDSQGIYDSTCKLKNPSQVLNKVCKDLSDNANTYGTCEGQRLDDMIWLAFENIVNFPNKLGRGEDCQVDLESKIRTAISDNRPVDGNKYKMLKILKDGQGGTGQGFCDYTKLQECSSSTGKCECIDNTEPRVNPNTCDESEHCYKTSGDCQVSSLEDLFDPMTTSEKTKVESHYGTPGDDCLYTKYCLFITKKKDGVCTNVNTGITGGVQKPKPTKPNPGPPGPDGSWNKPPGNGWGEAGVGRICVASWSALGFMTITILLYFTIDQICT